jgi:hypothetical protein
MNPGQLNFLKARRDSAKVQHHTAVEKAEKYQERNGFDPKLRELRMDVKYAWANYDDLNRSVMAIVRHK